MMFGLLEVRIESSNPVALPTITNYEFDAQALAGGKGYYLELLAFGIDNFSLK